MVTEIQYSEHNYQQQTKNWLKDYNADVPPNCNPYDKAIATGDGMYMHAINCGYASAETPWSQLLYIFFQFLSMSLIIIIIIVSIL